MTLVSGDLLINLNISNSTYLTLSSRYPLLETRVSDEPVTPNMEAYRVMSFGMAWAMLIMCSIGVMTNLVSIFVYTHPVMKRAPINVLLTGLSVIDLFLLLLSVPAFIIPGFFTYYQTWTLELIMSYSSVFVYPLTSTTHTASVWTFVIIALERWHAVNQGGRENTVGRQESLLRRKRRHTCVCALIAVCVISFVYNGVRFFEFELVHNEPSPYDMGLNDVDLSHFTLDVHEVIAASKAATDNHTGQLPTTTTALYTAAFLTPLPLYTDPDPLKTPPSFSGIPSVVPLLRNGTAHPLYMQGYFVGLYLVTHFAAPFISLVIVNGLTLHVVYIAKQRRKRLLTRRERREHRTTRMMITVVVMFLVCYTLVISLNIIEGIDPNWFQTDENRLVAYLLNDVSNLLVIGNAASTALIYYLFNRQYRELCSAYISKIASYLDSCFSFCGWRWCHRVFQPFIGDRRRFCDRRLGSGPGISDENPSGRRDFLTVPPASSGRRLISCSSSFDLGTAE